MESAPYPLGVYFLLIPATHPRKTKQVKSTFLERIRDPGCLKKRDEALNAPLIEENQKR